MSLVVHRHSASDNLSELLETGFMLRRRIIGFGVLTVALALAIALSVKPNYVATSQLIVLPSDEYTFRATAGSHSLANEALSRHAMMGSEVAILKSPELAHAVIATIGLPALDPAMLRKPGLLARLIAHLRGPAAPTPGATARQTEIDRAVPVFESRLAVAAGTADDIITLKFADPNPAMARRVLSTLERLYLVRRRGIFTDQQSAAVARQVAVERHSLDRAEARLTAFQAAHNVTQFHTRAAILLNQQGQLEQDLMTTTSGIAQLTTKLAVLRKQHATVAPTISLKQSINIDKRTIALRNSLDGLRTTLATLLSNYRADSPEVINLRRKITTEQALLDHANADAAPSALQSGQNPIYAQINVELLQDTANRATARIRAAQDRKGLTHIANQLSRLDALKAESSDLSRQQKVAAAAYADAAKTLSGREMVEQVDAEKRANVRVMSAPTQPIYPYPLRKLIMLGGAILATIGAIAIVLLGNFFRAGALLARVFEAQTGIPTLAVIPELKAPQTLRLPAGRPGG